MANMSAVDAAFGLAQWGPVKDDACHLYTIATTPTVAVYHNDFMTIQGTTAITPHMGSLPTVENTTAAAAGAGAGVVQALFDIDMKPILYMPTTLAGNGVVAGYILLNDDPLQRYIIQEDGTTSVVAADIGLNFPIIVATGDNDTGISKTVLDSSGHGTDVAFDVKALGVHPEDVLATSGNGVYCRIIVMLNNARRAPNVVGVS